MAATSGRAGPCAPAVRAARGSIIVTLDGDGQNDPADIPKLLEVMRADTTGRVGMVSGVRVRRNDDANKRFASDFANRFRRWLLHDGAVDSGCGLKVFPARGLSGAALFRQHAPLSHRAGPARGAYEVKFVDVNHRAREHGKSNTTISAGRWSASSMCSACAGYSTAIAAPSRPGRSRCKPSLPGSRPTMSGRVIGYGGQGLFAARFIVQWFESEKEGRSVIPVAFWYCSVGGGIVLLAYAVYKQEGVFIIGQASGLHRLCAQSVADRQGAGGAEGRGGEPGRLTIRSCISLGAAPFPPQYGTRVNRPFPGE